MVDAPAMGAGGAHWLKHRRTMLRRFVENPTLCRFAANEAISFIGARSLPLDAIESGWRPQVATTRAAVRQSPPPRSMLVVHV